MFLVSMADIIGSYERLPNDAVRAVAVAKRREYVNILVHIGKHPHVHIYIYEYVYRYLYVYMYVLYCSVV